ncbi:MAG: Tm-1-like ATP-binding domain-containing protein, partial [Opitutaceae bacterium]
MPTIAVLGTFDTKGPEHAFVADRIRSRGHTPLLITVGCRGAPAVKPDIASEEVAARGDEDWCAIL